MNASTATTTRAPSSALRASSESGKSDSGSAPRSTSTSMLPAAAALRIPVASDPVGCGRRPSCSAPTTLPRRRAGRTLTSGWIARDLLEDGAQRRGGDAPDSARFGRPATTTTGPARSWSWIAGSSSAAAAAAAPPASMRMLRHALRLRPVAVGDSSMRRRGTPGPGRALLDRMAQPQEQDAELLLRVGPEQDDRRGRRRLVDGRAGQAEHLGREPVADLRVAVDDTEGVGELGPREGVLVRAVGTAENGDALRTTRVDRGPDQRRRRPRSPRPTMSR